MGLRSTPISSNLLCSIYVFFINRYFVCSQYKIEKTKNNTKTIKKTQKKNVSGDIINYKTLNIKIDLLCAMFNYGLSPILLFQFARITTASIFSDFDFILPISISDDGFTNLNDFRRFW